MQGLGYWVRGLGCVAAEELEASYHCQEAMLATMCLYHDHFLVVPDQQPRESRDHDHQFSTQSSVLWGFHAGAHV